MPQNAPHHQLGNIKITVIVTAIIASIFTVIIMGFVSDGNQANINSYARNNEVLDQQTLQLGLNNLALRVDGRIAQLKLIAKTVANDTHIHASINDSTLTEDAPILVDKLQFLVDEFGLTSASFANTQTNEYWNHQGFLRVLQPSIDTWYFAYTASGEQDLISVYHDKNNNRVDLYVNYRQLNGIGLSGIATSFNGVLNMLSESQLAASGEIFLVDSTGKVQVHANADIAGSVSLAELSSPETAAILLQEVLQETTHSPVFEPSNNTKFAASYMPNMGWYLVLSSQLALTN
jgi:methyl-accepting chemotaxis protein